MIRGIKDVGVVGNAKIVNLVEDHSDGAVHIQTSPRFADASIAPAINTIAPGCSSTALRQLHIKRLAGLDLSSDKRDTAFSDPVILFRRAIALVKAMPGGVSSSHMPLTEMGGGVAHLLEHLRNRDFFQGHFQERPRRDHFSFPASAWRYKGHVKLCRAFAGEIRGTGGGASWRGSIEVREPHASRCQSLQMGSDEDVAPGIRNPGVQLDGRAGPALTFPQDKDEVWVLRMSGFALGLWYLLPLPGLCLQKRLRSKKSADKTDRHGAN